MTTYRAGAIGRTGRGNWGHGLDMAFAGWPEVEFAAVADDDPEGLKAAGERTGVGALYADYREMLDKEDLDLVAVCPRWVGPHAEMVIASAQAGVKGILCEKPFAATLSEADAMLEACERAGTRVAVAHRRANPYEQHAKRLVEEGAVGDLQVLRAHGKCDRRSGAQDLMVLGTHMMDSMRYIAGSDVAWANGHVTQDGRDVTVEDIRDGDEEIGLIAGNGVSAYYAFENGVMAYFDSMPSEMTSERSGSWFGFEVYGSSGIISVRNSPKGNMFVYPHGQWIPGHNDDDMWEPVVIDEWERRQKAQGASPTHLSNRMIVAELLQAIEEGRDVVASSSGRDARAALEMIMAVHESHRLRRRVYFPMSNRENPYQVWSKETG
jgi:predicted dehydrogenase